MSLTNPAGRAAVLTLLAAVILAACSPASPTPTPAPGETPTGAVQPEPSPTDAPAARSLTVCLGEQPNTLFLYGSPNAAARSVFQAIYDGPVDTLGYAYQAVIFTQVPSLEDGSAALTPVPVEYGSAVVDASGELATLEEGVTIYPAGCRSAECAVEYGGEETIQMDQLVVSFQLLSDLKWSDGQPLTADDLVFSYELASAPDFTLNTYLLDRTADFSQLDEVTVQWTGVPGFIDPDFPTNFWSPLPRHLLGEIDPAELAESEAASLSPVGWGPYMIQEWIEGEQIILGRNPNYFRADEGLPAFETLSFRFVADANQAVSDLISGGCDVLDTTIRLDGQVGLLQQFAESGQVQFSIVPTMVLERLEFGIAPAAYDDGYNVTAGDRPDLLGDARTRQAVIQCLDRERVINRVLSGLSEVPASFFPADHPLASPELEPYAYDPDAAGALLDEVGWLDADEDPLTPRVASGVEGVPDGTQLVLRYYTSSALQRRQGSEILAESLRACGIGVELKYFDSSALYAPGPEGPLFGRQFDLAQFAMSTTGVVPACGWYTAAEIPASENDWIGTNVSGYRSQEYDVACRQALGSLPGEEAYQQAYWDLQSIFVTDVPAVPLYLRLKSMAARPDLCGLELDGSAPADLWNLEALQVGAACSQP